MSNATENPQPVGPPSKHQLALIIWVAVFPTLTLLNLTIGPWLADAGPVRIARSAAIASSSWTETVASFTTIVPCASRLMTRPARSFDFSSSPRSAGRSRLVRAIRAI